jgi:cyanate permease
LWAYYVIWGLVIGAAIHMSYIIPVDKTLANWFISKRGLAQGIKFFVLSIVAVVILPIIAWQVVHQGWRLTCLIWAAVWLVSMPFVFVFIKQKRPEYYGLLPDGARVEPGARANVEEMINKGVAYASGLEEVEFTLRQALRTPAFWMLLASMIFNSVIWGGFNLHFIPFLTDRGIEPTAAGAMMGAMIFFTAPSRLFSGLAADRVKKDRLQFLIAGIFVLQVLGLAAFAIKQSTAMIWVMLALYGLGSGATGPVYLTIFGRYFGRKAYGSIIGATSLLAAPIQLGSPVLAGWIYDTTGDYLDAFLIYIVVSVISIVLLCLTHPPKAPAYITGIKQFM